MTPSPILMNEALLDDFIYLSQNSFCCIYNISHEEYDNAANQIKFWAKIYKQHYGKELKNRCSSDVNTTDIQSDVKVTENVW